MGLVVRAVMEHIGHFWKKSPILVQMITNMSCLSSKFYKQLTDIDIVFIYHVSFVRRIFIDLQS